MIDYSSVIAKAKPSIALLLCLKDNVLSSTGSGFIFSSNEIVVTCDHVIKDASQIKVRFPDSEEFYDAKIVIRDSEHDLALLKISGNSRSPLPFAKQDTVVEGMPVVFAGYPLQIFSLTSHCGIISCIAQDPTGVITYMIDGTVNSGNSGCPLMNIKGEVIGVINAKRMERTELLEKVQQMQFGALSLHGVDLVEIYQALIRNVQLGIGYAVPASYIPEHKKPDVPLNPNQNI